MKKMVSVILAVMLLSVSIVAMAETPVIEKIEYEGNGYIELDFLRDVEYQSPSVSVTNASGENLSVSILELDDDDMTIRADGMVKGQSYTITVSGIRSGRTGSFETISGEIALPEEGVPAIQSVEYDRKDQELDIDFMERVDYQNLTVEVTDLNGNLYQAQIGETDSDSIELWVSGLTEGQSYLVKVSGVSLWGMNQYQTVSQEFVALDR